MFLYTVQQANGFHGGVAETFQLIERDGKKEINGIVSKFGRLEPLSTQTGHWTFRAYGLVVLDVDLDSVNGV